MIKDIYRLTEDQENNLWTNAVFVFDTSALLNLYDYSDDTISDIFTSTFEDLKGRIWLPFNVTMEYIASRHKPIDKSKEEYKSLENNLTSINNHINQIINKTKSKDKHPFLENIDLELFKKNFEDLNSKVITQIKEKKDLLSHKLDDDKILDFINSSFSLGHKYSYSQISEIILEGEFRFRNDIPPGFKDASKKKGFQKYSDLIIWKQIIDYSNEFNKDIVYIMDDLKEDWWILNKSNKPLSPRNELIIELDSTSGKKFWMYQTSEFIKKSKEIIKSNIKSESIQDILAVSEKYFLSSKISHGIELSANREEEEPWRIKRLENIAIFYSKALPEINISELYDHKGTLTVFWNKEPSDKEKKTIQMAWENENELEDNVEHIIIEN